MNAKYSRRMVLCLLLLAVGFGLPSQVLADDADKGKQWVTYEPNPGAGSGKHVVFVAAGWEYRAEEGLTMLAKMLAKRHGIKSTVLFVINKEDGTIDPNVTDNIPGLDHLDSADMMVFLGMDLELPDDQMKHFVDFVDSGKPILGFRCAVLAFKNLAKRNSPYAKYDTPPGDKDGGFGSLVLGDNWRGHHGHHAVESTRGLINGRRRGHPILKGVAGDIWGPTDVYRINKLPANAAVLVYGQVLQGMKPGDPPNLKKPIMPMIWAYERDVNGKQARVVTSTIGASQDLASEDLRRVIINGIYWGLAMEDKIPEKSNVDYVDGYEPTVFGRNKFIKGQRPSDYEIKIIGK